MRKAVIENGADLSAKNEYGETVLMVAAPWGHTEIVQMLLQAGADVNAQDVYGDTAIVKAATGGHAEIVKMLKEAGSPGVTLIQAAGNGLLEIVRALLESGADVNAQDEKSGLTALMWAAGEGHAEVVQMLLKSGADVNAKTTPNGFTPLMEAAKAGYADIVTLLLEAGADPTLTDRVGRNAAEWGSDYADIVTMLGGTPSKKAATTGEVTPEQRERAKQRLLELGYREVTEEMFVMSATRGELEAVKAFVEYGLSVDSKDPRDHTTTPLLRAATLDTPDVGLFLIQAGADVNAKDTNGSTALIWAAEKCGLQELVRALVDAGADVNAKAAGGATPLMMAEIFQCAENIAILQQAGAQK